MSIKENSPVVAKWIYIGLGACIFLLIIVVFQNIDRIPVKILFWQFDVPKLAMALLFFVLGFLTGRFVKKPRSSRGSS